MVFEGAYCPLYHRGINQTINLVLPNQADDKQTEAQKKAYKIFKALGLGSQHH